MSDRFFQCHSHSGVKTRQDSIADTAKSILNRVADTTKSKFDNVINTAKLDSVMLLRPLSQKLGDVDTAESMKTLLYNQIHMYRNALNLARRPKL
jgi:hypothetical protein